jgi:hypothetical protein
LQSFGEVVAQKFERPDSHALPTFVSADAGNATPKTVHGRPRFARRSFRDGIKEQIAPVHPDFVCGSYRCP